MRFGITLKMFLAVLIACLIISLTMGYAVRLSFENGFLHYVRERDARRVKALSAKLSTEYAIHGNWDFLRERPQIWLSLLDAAQQESLQQENTEMQAVARHSWQSFLVRSSVQEHVGSLSGHPGVSQWGMRLPPMTANDNTARSLAFEQHLGSVPGTAASDSSLPVPSSMPRSPGEYPPTTLLDANKQLVATNSAMQPSDRMLKSVIYNGLVVGWLDTRGPAIISDTADLQFQAQQTRATWEIAGVSVILAAIVAMVLARIVLAPVKRLVNATHRLANGDYTTRVKAGRRDELDQLAGDFNVLADSLEKAERSRRDFIADISHELRTPLAVLRGELEAIEDGVHAFNSDSLTSLQSEVAMLNKLIEDLYELSLSDVGALSYNKVPADIAPLVNASVDAFRESFKTKQIALDLVLPASLGKAAVSTCFHVDPARFVQLLKNLLQNSLRYTDAHGVVRVALKVDPLGWQIDIHDSLPGVPTQALPHLFERLYRVDDSRSRQSGGAGLGLALCRAIVVAHSGTIQAEPSYLGGIWIHMRFPIEASQI